MHWRCGRGLLPGRGERRDERGPWLEAGALADLLREPCRDDVPAKRAVCLCGRTVVEVVHEERECGAMVAELDGMISQGRGNRNIGRTDLALENGELELENLGMRGQSCSDNFGIICRRTLEEEHGLESNSFRVRVRCS